MEDRRRTRRHRGTKPSALTPPGKPNLLAIAIVFSRDFTDPPPIRRIPSSTNASKGVGDKKDGESAEETSFAACVASLCCSAWKDLNYGTGSPDYYWAKRPVNRTTRHLFRALEPSSSISFFHATIRPEPRSPLRRLCCPDSHRAGRREGNGNGTEQETADQQRRGEEAE
jgi:hypothetical protein